MDVARRRDACGVGTGAAAGTTGCGARLGGGGGRGGARGQLEQGAGDQGPRRVEAVRGSHRRPRGRPPPRRARRACRPSARCSRRGPRGSDRGGAGAGAGSRPRLRRGEGESEAGVMERHGALDGGRDHDRRAQARWRSPGGRCKRRACACTGCWRPRWSRGSRPAARCEETAAPWRRGGSQKERCGARGDVIERGRMTSCPSPNIAPARSRAQGYDSPQERLRRHTARTESRASEAVGPEMALVRAYALPWNRARSTTSRRRGRSRGRSTATCSRCCSRAGSSSASTCSSSPASG